MKPFRRAFFIWGWALLALSGLFWLSLFCYSPIPISPLNALHALLAPESPSLAEALVLNLRLPRSLVAIMLGASLAMSRRYYKRLPIIRWHRLHCSALIAARRWRWR